MTIQTWDRAIAGQSVHYLTAGTESGMPVVLLHGARFSSATWQQLGTLDFLAQQGCYAVALDLPGFGASAPNPLTPGQWLPLALDTLNLRSPILLIASMSGRFAWPLLTTAPNRVRGLVAIAPVGIPRDRESLEQITCPVLAIWGEQDSTIPIQEAERLVQSVPHGQLVVIPQGSHAPYMNHPQIVHQTLMAFLQHINVD